LPDLAWNYDLPNFNLWCSYNDKWQPPPHLARIQKNLQFTACFQVG
jgi:hypothetical protein